MGLEIADVFRRFGGAYLSRHGTAVLPLHRRAIADILACRTPAMGGHEWHCPHCHQNIYVYHGCRNRSCPACHTQQTREWLQARQAELLPCDYFHVTATIPAELRAIFRSHQKELYALFMQTAAEAVLTLCRDPKHLGATPGLLAVLHTWTGRLDFHPHIHFLVTAGGVSADGQNWISSKPGFLVPVKALSRLVRARLRAALQKKNAELYASIPRVVWRREWVADCRPWGGGERGVLDYLARYVFRIAISNRRLIAMDNQSVTFQYKDRTHNCWRTCRLSGEEFMRRYLQHVLPKGLHKVRYYGLWHPVHRPLAAQVRQRLLLDRPQPTVLLLAPIPTLNEPAPWISDVDSAQPPPPSRCPHCGATTLIYVREIPRRLTSGP